MFRLLMASTGFMRDARHAGIPLCIHGGTRARAGVSLSGVFGRQAAGRGQRNEQAERSAGGCEGRAE